MNDYVKVAIEMRLCDSYELDLGCKIVDKLEHRS